jgi:hypothetical protein
MLSAIFFLLSVLSYHVVTDQPTPWVIGGALPTTGAKVTCFALSVFFSVLSMLSKETGLTALGVCVALEIICALRGIGIGSAKSSSTSTKSRSLVHPALRSAVLAACTVALTAARIAWTGRPTVFMAADNQAAFHPDLLTRFLSFNHLYAFNMKLLVFPLTLCHDWNGNAIPLVQELSDPRLLLPVAMYIVLFAVGIKGIVGAMGSSSSGGQHRCCLSNATLVGMALLVVPFVPSTGIFFTVGFTVAERVLYLPSAGFCMVAGCGAQLLKDKLAGKAAKISTNAALLLLALCAIIALAAARTWSRNTAWSDEIMLYEAALDSCPGNAKSHYNYAHFLSQNGNPKGVDTLHHYRTAHAMDPTDPTYVSPLALAKAMAGDVAGGLPLFELAVETSEKHRKRSNRVDPYLNLLVTYRNLQSKHCSYGCATRPFTLCHQCTATR